MASNEIPLNITPLISLAEDAADGAASEGASVGLEQNTEPKIRADLIALVGDPTATPAVPGAQGTYAAAKSAKVASTAAKNAAVRAGRAFVSTAVGVLKPFLGTQWNSQWQAVGFTDGSLAVPRDPLPVLNTMRDYFAANPTQENAPLDITADEAEVQIQAISDARSASNASNAALGTAKAARDAAQRALYKRLSGLLAELTQLLGPEDPRWYAFGFERPADGEHPDAIEHLVLTPGSPGMVFADWDHATRAERYRVYKQVLGVDPEPVLVDGSVADSEYPLIGLPSAAEVTVTVEAVNDAGAGEPASGVVTVP